MENYIKLDKNKIFEEANKLLSQNLPYSDELFEALGGTNLNRIFDKFTIKKFIESIITTQKFHSFLEGDGLDVLEGFLNNKVTKPIGEFYNINPEYILALPPEEQEKMAEAVSEGNKDLVKVLTYIWSQKIKTIACGGKSVPGYLYVNIPLSDIRTLTTYKSLNEKKGYPVDIEFNPSYEDQESSLLLNIFGPPEQLYNELLSEFKVNEKIDFTDSFDSNFLESIKLGTDFANELYQSGIKRNTGFSDNDVEKLLEDSDLAHKEQYDELEKKYSELLEEHSSLKEKYSNLKQSFSTVKNFVVNKIGKIPFLGKRVIHLLDDELKNNALPAPEEDKTENIDSDLIH